jgi:hypothetical protein
MEQRNLLMKIRMEDTSMRKYEITNTGFGETDLIERKLKSKQIDKYDKNAKTREILDFSKGQKAHKNCKMCFFNKKQSYDAFMDIKIGESSHWFILYPTNIRPLSPIGAVEAVTHV